MQNDFLKTLEPYATAGGFSPLDLHFARFMAKLAGAESAELALAAALVSRQTGTGHICLDLAAAAGKKARSQREKTLLSPSLWRFFKVQQVNPSRSIGGGWDWPNGRWGRCRKQPPLSGSSRDGLRHREYSSAVSARNGGATIDCYPSRAAADRNEARFHPL